MTRVVVSRDRDGQGDPGPCPGAEAAGATQDRQEDGDATWDRHGDSEVTRDRDEDADATWERCRAERLAAWLRAAAALLPSTLGGVPSQPLEFGRAARVVTPAQRSALVVRDGGCVFPACDRPLAWCDAHHLVSWLDGGPTDLANLPWCAGPITGRSMRGAGSWPAVLMGGSRPLHRIEDTGPLDGAPAA